MRIPRRRRAIVPIIFLVALLGYTVWPWLPFSRAEATPPTIVFYGFSILADVMQEGVIPAFQRAWAAEGHGRVEIVIAGDRHDLDVGDVLAFPGNTLHSYRNLDTRRPARGISVVILAKAGV